MSGKEINKIKFHFLTAPFSLRNRTLLKRFILALFTAEGRTVEAVNYIFCTDDYLLEVNRQYLNHDFYTDIITFDLSSANGYVVSDIYISIDRVRENSNSYKTSFTKELHRVIFHGALHLVGYKDKSAKQSKQMRQKEDEHLSAYFVSRNTVSY
jgi:rRNA maturation RNase YbeY